MNISRQIGTNINVLMKHKGISYQELCHELNYSYKDFCRIFDGRLMISPTELGIIAKVLSVEKKELLKKNNIFEFNNDENLEKILSLIDNYIELKEAT